MITRCSSEIADPGPNPPDELTPHGIELKVKVGERIVNICGLFDSETRRHEGRTLGQAGAALAVPHKEQQNRQRHRSHDQRVHPVNVAACAARAIRTEQRQRTANQN